ncbi:Deoxyribose-phosphate aldolase [Blautia producta]|uniref:Deoxyribose-phosphate aldolase n=1 Tax=Blautia producta TaxID=33035 RepID=A0A4P6LX89_9FIRM|nr:deoxyribose-phosphate aldolase [Blautia producta]QBE97184.1 Deoxyribose-phosphate aldolase [Blautia producta]
MTENREILRHIDHTLLKATAEWEEIRKLCEEAVTYGTASVCIPPCYVERVHKSFGNSLDICTVIGFPLGYSTRETKVFEAKDAVSKGAREVDMVINITDLKNGDTKKVTDEIRAVKDAVGNTVLKVIIETCYLTEQEKIAMCRAVTQAGADYIKTSTGFGTKGVSIEDIRLFKEYIGENVKIKAAGGIRTREELEAFLSEGCDRIGTSSAVKLLTESTDS